MKPPRVEVVRAVPRICIVNTVICLTKDVKEWKNSVMVTQGRLALASGDGVNPRSACCHNRGFPTSANFESKLSVCALMCSQTAKHPDPRVSARYHLNQFGQRAPIYRIAATEGASCGGPRQDAALWTVAGGTRGSTPELRERCH